jgi:eukaryotic-like serine/threonine-protein kinase
VIREKYRILRRVGVGGMATVYQAEHLHFHEICALKVINAGLVHDETLLDRFIREAVLTRRLRHPNAVRVDDIDRAEDGRPFMVMEFLEGQSLHEIIHHEAPLAYSRTAKIAAQVAAAIHAAHEVGIIHRDIKPANITIIQTQEGEVAKVLDFGIAKLKEGRVDHAVDNDFTLTVAGMVVGTPAYVSPEQAQGKRGSELDGRSDVYSFAVVFYQMLTGKLPIHAETEEQFVVAHATAAPDDINTHIKDLPPPVAALIMQCLSKDPNRRPADPQVLSDEMQNWEKLDEHQPPPISRPLPKTPFHAPRWAMVCLAAALAVFTVALFSFIFYKYKATAKTDPSRVQATLIQPPSLVLPSGDMTLIPPGPALFGENNRTQSLPAFYIDKTEVSTRAYLEFCRQTHHRAPPAISLTDLDLPIRNVDFAEAEAFAGWAHKRLPSAAEWEKAARGTQGQHFPWGNDLGTGMARLPLTPEESAANSTPQAIPSNVDSFPQGASSYGALNMVGNVWEWVNSPVQIRGGSYQVYPPQMNLSFESLLYAGQNVPANIRRPDIGFRCAR